MHIPSDMYQSSYVAGYNCPWQTLFLFQNFLHIVGDMAEEQAKTSIDHVEKNLARTISDSEDVKGADFTVDESDLPKGYFVSLPFLGSMLAIGISFACGVGGFAFAAPILSYINADIGPDPNLLWVALTYTLTTGVCLILVGSESYWYPGFLLCTLANCIPQDCPTCSAAGGTSSA